MTAPERTEADLGQRLRGSNPLPPPPKDPGYSQRSLPRPRGGSKSSSSTNCVAACSWGFNCSVVKSGPMKIREAVPVKPGKSAAVSPSSWITVRADLLANGLFHVQNNPNQDDMHQVIPLGILPRKRVYLLSDTVYNTENCIVVRTSSHEAFHLISPQADRDQWFVLLKLFCISDIAHLQRTVSFRSRSILTLIVQEARQVAVKASIRLGCSVMVNQEIRGRTGLSVVEPSLSTYWRKEFVLNDLPGTQHQVQINLTSEKNPDATIGHALIMIDTTNGKASGEDWHMLRREHKYLHISSLQNLASSNTTSDSSAGEVRVSWGFESHAILPLYCYRDLIRVLRETWCIEALYGIVRKIPEPMALANNLLRIYEGLGLVVPWIKSLVDYELASLHADDVNLLFRASSPATKVIDAYMHMKGMNFLEEAIGDIIRALCKESVFTEVDPARLEKGDSLSLHCEQLFHYVHMVWESIRAARTMCPPELCAIFSHIQSSVVRILCLDKSDKERRSSARYTCVSGFLFLRFICPAIISPASFGLVHDIPDAKTSRTLTLVAKCLMNLANLTEPNPTETWMLFLVNFIKKNTVSFKSLIDTISNMPGPDLLDKKTEAGLSSIVPFDVLAEKSTEDIAVPPHFVDLPLELARFSKSVIHSWQETDPDNPTDLYKICSTVVSNQSMF